MDPSGRWTPTYLLPTLPLPFFSSLTHLPHPTNPHRANKINDQIAIMKSILEGVGLRPPCTKSSILSEGIALVRHLLATADQEKLAALRAKSNDNDGMLGSGSVGDEEAGGGGAMMDTSGLESASVSVSTGPSQAATGEREPYILLFRKSATPLAMAGPDGLYRFLDWCVRACGRGLGSERVDG
jgi:hypothetical protein